GILQTSAAQDIFIAKLQNLNGIPLFVKRFGDADAQFGTGIAADPAGNIYTTGYFTGSIDFGGAVKLTSAGVGENLWVAKFKSVGDIQWARRYGDTGNTRGGSIAADSSSVIVGGTFDGSVTITSAPLTSAGGLDVFVAKLDTSGNVVWSMKGGDAADQFMGGV